MPRKGFSSAPNSLLVLVAPDFVAADQEGREERRRGGEGKGARGEYTCVVRGQSDWRGDRGFYHSQLLSRGGQTCRMLSFLWDQIVLCTALHCSRLLCTARTCSVVHRTALHDLLFIGFIILNSFLLVAADPAGAKQPVSGA